MKCPDEQIIILNNKQLKPAKHGSLVMVRGFWTLDWSTLFNQPNKMNNSLAEPADTSDHLRLV